MESIGILALQGDFQAHGAALARLGLPHHFIRTPADLERASGLIIPGGESTTLLKLLDSEGLWNPLLRFAESRAVFGTCAGAILMADQVEHPAQRSLGLIHITVRRNAYGRQLSSSIRQADWASDPEDPEEPSSAELPLDVVLIRAPIITATGRDVRILVRLGEQPILVRQAHFLAATFHPELTSDGRVHRYFAHIVENGCHNEVPEGSG